MSKIKTIAMPECVKPIGQKVPKDMGFMSGSDIYGYRTGNASVMIIPCMVDQSIAMPFDNVEALISDLRENLGENEGLITVESGVNANNQRYVYFIKKHLNNDDGIPEGMDYQLNLNIEIDSKIWFVQSSFKEEGTTGFRETTVMALIKSQNKEFDFAKDGWFEDPYDPTFTKGLPMNISEQEQFDELFPEHPLSELRRFVKYIMENNPNSTNDNGNKKKLFDVSSLAAMAKDEIGKIDVTSFKEKAALAGDVLGDKAIEVKDAALKAKEDLEAKLTELDRMLESSITEYNDTYTLMNDKGVQLFIERSRSSDLITNVQNLVNSIANHPKEFDTDFETINSERSKFTDTCEFADKELKAARQAASGAGAGLAAGASVAFMAPTAAMWVATTFGTASTGAAISTLTGAAASNAALAWLGGGALAAGGGGMSAGSALLALAGPIGWSIAGATLLTSIILFASKRSKLNKEKNEEIESVKHNIEVVKEIDSKIAAILNDTTRIRSELSNSYTDSLTMFGEDYSAFSDDQKLKLGALVNNTKALSALFGKTAE